MPKNNVQSVEWKLEDDVNDFVKVLAEKFEAKKKSAPETHSAFELL